MSATEAVRVLAEYRGAVESWSQLVEEAVAGGEEMMIN